MYFFGLSSVSAEYLGSFPEEICTYIELYPSKIVGSHGDRVALTADVKQSFLFEPDEIVNLGNLSLLKDGEVLQVKDLSEDSYPVFLFTLERGHKYSLKYDKCFTDKSEVAYYKSTSKEIPVTIHPCIYSNN